MFFFIQPLKSCARGWQSRSTIGWQGHRAELAWVSSAEYSSSHLWCTSVHDGPFSIIINIHQQQPISYESFCFLLFCTDTISDVHYHFLQATTQKKKFSACRVTGSNLSPVSLPKLIPLQFVKQAKLCKPSFNLPAPAINSVWLTKNAAEGADKLGFSTQHVTGSLWYGYQAVRHIWGQGDSSAWQPMSASWTRRTYGINRINLFNNATQLDQYRRFVKHANTND